LRQSGGIIRVQQLISGFKFQADDCPPVFFTVRRFDDFRKYPPLVSYSISA
jgi:hypothetical protein